MRGLFWMIFLCINYVQAQPSVRECDVLFRRRIVRSIDLRDKTNTSLFRREDGIVRILMDALEEGRIHAYSPMDKKKLISSEDFNNKIIIPTENNSGESYQDFHLYKIEIEEDLIFDKQRSVPVYEIKYISIFLPLEMNYRGMLEPLATFKYQDCLKIFKEDKRAVCDLNDGKPLNFKDIFILHKYQSFIVKIGDENEMYFDQKYPNPMQAFIEEKNAENEIVEYFYRLYNPQ